MIKKLCLLLLLAFSLELSAQTYQEFAEKGIDYLQKDSFLRAEYFFKEALRADPKNGHNVFLYSNLGLAQQRLGANEAAIESYSYALNQAPLAVPILLSRASVYMTIGQPGRAYIDYCQVLDADKTNEEALLMRAYIYVDRRDYKAARLDYNRLLALSPQHVNGKLGLIRLNQLEQHCQEAFEDITSMIRLYPKDAMLYVVRANIEHEMKQDDLALIDLEEALKQDGCLADAYLLRGKIYLSRKKKGLAKLDLEKAAGLGIPLADLHELLRQCK